MVHDFRDDGKRGALTLRSDCASMPLHHPQRPLNWRQQATIHAGVTSPPQ